MARRPTRSTLGVRRRRRSEPVKMRLQAARWIDPFPDVPGTLPEKMIFAELVSRRIYFIFQGDFPKEDRYVQVTADDPGFKPDIIIPEWKIIIDPFGDYHHSKDFAGSVALDKLNLSDARKLAFYEAKGYEFLHPWSSEVVRYGAAWVVSQSKRLEGPPMFKLGAEDQRFKFSPGYQLGKYLGLGATSVGASNRKRRKPKGLLLRPSR